MGNQSANISFTPPANTGGLPILEYIVHAFVGGVDTAIAAVGSSSPILITALTNGVTYTFEVYAVNSAGIGPWSAPSNPFTPNPTVPTPPLSASASPGNASAVVLFSPPATNGGMPIQFYTATAYISGISTGISQVGAASPITIAGLMNGTTYTIEVTATNSIGPSAASVPSNPVTPSASATVPTAPLSPSAVPGNAEASVSFLPPLSNGGSAITSYTVTSSPEGLTASGAMSPIVIGFLTNGTAYTFTVTAANAVGTGPASVATTPVTPSGSTVPGAPTGVVGTSGNAQVSVAFTAPSNGGSAITGYTVMSSPAEPPFSGASSPIVVTGLTNGQAYTFTVTATNANGTGPASAPSLPVTPATVPGTPESIAAQGGNTQATVTFTAPVSNGGSPVTLYTAVSTPGGLSGTNSVSPVLVTGLTNGLSYTFAVAATNAVGQGAFNGPSNAVTPSTVPSAPTGVSATPGNAQCVVRFTPGANGGAAITLYTATSSPGNITGTSTTGSPITVTGLTNGTAYTFTVTATNANGPSVPSAPSTAVTPATVPNAPTALNAMAGNTQATIIFTQGSNGGSPINSWTATSSPGGIISSNTSGSPFIFNGLTNGTTYTFTIVATNAVGSSAPSAASNPVTPMASGFVITTTALAGGTVGVAYGGGPVVAAGGGSVPPYSYFVATGTLPPTLALATNGALSGTPTTPGTFNPGFQAVDSSGSASFPISTTVADNEGQGNVQTAGGITTVSSVPLVAGEPTICLTVCASYQGVTSTANYPTLRQSVTGASTGGNSVVSITATTGTATLANSTILVFAGNSFFQNHITASITDNVGNTYTLLLQNNDTNQLGPQQQGAQNQSMWVCNGATAGATTWTTMLKPPLGAPEDFQGIYVMEFTSATGVTAAIGTYTGPPTGIVAGANNVNTGVTNMGTAPITLVGFVQNTGPTAGSGTAGTSPIAFTTAGTTTPNWDWGGPNNALVEIANVTPTGNVGATAGFTSGNYTIQQAVGVIGTTANAPAAGPGGHNGRGLQSTNGNAITLQTFIQGPDHTAAGAPLNAARETDLYSIASAKGGTTTFQQWFGAAGFGNANTGDQSYQAFKAYQYTSGSTFVGFGSFTAQTGTNYAGVAQNTALLSGSITLTGAQVPCTLYGFCECTSSLGTNFVATPNNLPGGIVGTQIEQTWGFGAGSSANTSCYASWNITTPGTYTPSFNQNSTTLNCFQTVGWAVMGPSGAGLTTPVKVLPIVISSASGTPTAPADLYLAFQGQTSWNETSYTGGSNNPVPISNPNTNVLRWPATDKNGNPTGATSYTIRRSPDKTNWTVLAAGLTSRTYTDNGAGTGNGTTASSSVNGAITNPTNGVKFPSANFYYQVAGVNTNGQGPWSPTQSAYVYLGTADSSGPGGTPAYLQWPGNLSNNIIVTPNDTSSGPVGSQFALLLQQTGGSFWLPYASGNYCQWLLWGGAFGWFNFDIKPISGGTDFELQFHCVATQPGGDERIGPQNTNLLINPYVVGGTLATGQWCSVSIPYSAMLFDTNNVIQLMLYKVTIQGNGGGAAKWAMNRVRYSPTQGP